MFNSLFYLLVLLTTYSLQLTTVHAQGITGITGPSTIFTSPTNLVGAIVSRALPYTIIIAGLWFFVNFLIAGLGMLIAIGEPSKIATAKDRLLHSLIGFLIVLSAFFIARILELVFGLHIINV